MRSETVSMSVDGTPFDAFLFLSVRAALNEAARSFQCTVAARFGAGATHSLFRSGAEVRIGADGTPIFSGYVDRRRPHMDRNGQSIVVVGRSKGADAVDSSARHKTGRFDNKSPIDIAKEIAPKGVVFSARAKLQKIKEYQLTPGATVYREIERLARDQGVTLSGNGDGDIVFVDASQPTRRAGGLYEGVNIEIGVSDLNDANRHRDYIVRGQSYDGHGEDALEIEEIASDSAMRRDRARIIIVDGNIDKERAKARAKYHKGRAAGEAIRATITTPGWRDEKGALYEPGDTVWTESPFLDLAQDMLIESVDYQIESGSSGENGGSFCNLYLVDPRAYGGKAGKSSKSGADWSIGD